MALTGLVLAAACCIADLSVGSELARNASPVAVTCREDCWTLEDGDGAYVADGAKLEWSDGHVSVKPFADRFVLKYAFHPGARPKAGAVRLELVTHPVFAGAVRADFKCIGRPGTTNVVARRVGDRHVFDLRMPGKESWQLTQLAFSGNGDRRPFAVESVRWCAEGTSAEAFCLLPKRRADGLPLFFPEGGDVPGFVVENSADDKQEWSVCVAFTNRQGRFFSRSERIALPSGGRCQLDVPELRSCRGLWLAEATVRAADGSMARRTARIGVLDPNPVAPRLTGGKFRMGVNFHMGRYSGRQETRALDAINALGAKLVRGGAFVFSSFQPKGPDDWQTEANDRWMGRLKDRGLDVDAIVSFAPSWSWDAGHARLAKEKNWTYGAYSRPIPGAFGRFAEKLARRYGTDIAYYELGNEWDCISPEILTIDEGVALLKEVYAGLKRGNPDAILTTCGFAYGSSEDAPSMNQTNMHERITKEAAGFYDVHAVHAHCHEPHFSKRLGDFFRMRRRLGDNTPWYLNEAGISSFYGNEDVAAEYVWKKILFAWARGSRDYIWYTLRATGWNPKDFEQGFGLMTPDWNVRPAFLSFSALAHLLSGSDCDGILSDGDLQVYRFHDAAGNVVLAGWCRSDPKSYPFKLADVECRRVDLMGNRTPVASADGRYDLAFGRVPCAYLFSSAASAASAEPAAATQVHPAFGSLSWRQGDPALAALPVRTSEGAELRLTNSAVSVFLHESRRGFVGRAAWLRVRDAGGEIFQYRPIASADAGENFILSYSVANGKHDGKSWGGRNDGKLDLPFVLDSIVMGFTPPGGTVRLVSVETDEPGSPTTPVAACRFEIDTGTAYHVVTSADSPVAAVFINPSGRPARLVGTLRGLDAFERSFRQPLDVCVAAGGSVRVPLQGPLPAKGHWNVCAELDDGARKVYKAARFAWLDAHPKRTAKPVGRFRLGINFHGLWMTRDDLEIGLDALDACGCELVRVAFSGQCAVQKKGPEDWNWNEDWYLEKLKARHFAIDNLCHHLPGWIRDRSRPQMANDLVALEEFYARMAARYGTDIDYYEIGNEWDFWKPEVFEPAAALETYLASARGVKRGCPSAKVVPNGWATWDSAHPAVRVKDFPESFMRQAHGHYDAFPIHEHGEFTHYRKAILERFLPRRKSMGLDDVPWYAGETGLSSVNGNEIVVAENVWKKVLFSIAYGAADYVWYNLRATGWEENDPEAGFGLMTRDFQPRAGYAAFSSLATLLEGATFERILVSEKTREAYLFRKGDGKFVVGWDSQCFEPVEIPIRADVAQAAAIDLMGNRCPLVAESGTFTWKLGQRPSAVFFPGAKEVEPDRERICAVADPERRIPVRAKAGFDREPDVVCEELRFVHNSYEANPATVDRAWKGVKDHSFRAWFDLGDDWLRILVRVADDVHVQTASEPRLMSQGDCVRVDLRVPGLIGLWRLGFRRTSDGKSDSCVWVAPAGTDLEKASAALRLKTRRTGGVTDYAMTIPFAEFSLSEKAFADGVGVWIMSDDNDGPGTDGWTGLSDCVVLTCDPNADKSDLYVMLPAAVYDGNRAFSPVATDGKWPPHYAGEEEIAVRPRRLAANCLQALKPDGSGVIRLKASDLSVPCAGVWNRTTGRARIVFAPQKVGDEEVELSVSGDRIALSPPEAEKAAKVFDFKAESLADFYETFARNRKCLWPGAALKADDVAGKVRAVVDHCNRNRWKNGAYRTVEGYFAPGWISGAPLAHALLGSSDPLTHQRAVDTLDYLVGHQAATGFFPRLDAEGRPKDHRWIDPTLPTDHALRYSVDAFYWLVRALEKEGTHETWKAGVRKAADAFVRLWKEYGEFGQHANLETGKLRVGGSAVGALVPPALLKASVLLEKSDYAAVAEAAAERYARTFIEKGVSYGGPPDALMAPDSESAYMLVVMAVAMAERTQSDLWKKRAMSAADQFSTWVVPYRFAFPEGCEMARHHVDTTGSVWANVQNRHSAPGICTMSGESLLALSKLTGERRFAGLYADIKAFLPQVVSTESDPITARLYTAKPRQLPAGFMNERVNMSTWEKPAGVGEVFCGSCWPEACLLLMYPEYVRTGRLCPEAPGAVFIEGETVSFRADGVPAGKSCRVLDWLGAAVAEGSVGADGCVRMTGIPVGYYRLSLEGCRDATFAVVPDPAKRVRDVRSFVGVDSALSWCWNRGLVDCPWYAGDTFRLGRELLIRSGVPHVRERLNWGEVQGRPDISPQWGRYLVNARELSKSGVFVTDMFHDAPAWTGFVGRHLPSDLKALHGFCAAFARDFSGFVTDCEFWNEQDISNLSDEGAWDFAACMKAAFLGFRQGDPKLVVAPGAVCRDGRNAYDEVLYRNAMGKYCDVFNFHTYNSVASLPSLAADARNHLTRAGITGRALWMTECGTNREGPALGESGKEGIRAASPLQELVWAESIPKTQLVNLFNGVSRSYTFVFAAYNEQGGIKDWGVVRRDGTVKPSFSALSTLAGEVGDGAELIGRLRLADGKAVGYLFRKGDSSQTLVYWSLSSMDEGGGIITELPLGERRFSLAAKDGEYRLTDMCGHMTRVRSSGGRLELTATRYPAYLSGLSGLKPEEAPVPPGRVGPVPAASDEDLSVIVRVDADKGDFRLGAGRSRLEMTGEQGKMRVSVWNLDSRTKRGTLTASGGTLSGMPKDIVIPAGGVVRFDAVYTPDFKKGGCETELWLDGKFEGRRTTPCVVPMYSESLFLKMARFVTLDAMRPERWKRNTSAQKYSCVWDEKEKALRFDVEWTEPVDRWFYPQYALTEGESLEGARQLVFEVRTEQDKVENDFVATLAFFRSATSEYERPFRTWERRSVELPRPAAEPLTGFSLGCNPKGRKLTFWLRNLRAVYGKPARRGND